ncbi:hypothetical protein D3C75_804320 [compost metagenome]
MRCFELGDGGADGLVFGHRAAAQAWGNGCALGELGGNVLGKLQVHRTRLLFFGQANGFADARRDVIRRRKLMGVLGQRRHHGAHVENLETTLLGFLDGFLAGDHHRHSAQIRISAGCHQVGRTRAEGRQAHPGLAGEAAIRGSHEAGGLLVAGQDQLD